MKNYINEELQKELYKLKVYTYEPPNIIICNICNKRFQELNILICEDVYKNIPYKNNICIECNLKIYHNRKITTHKKSRKIMK